MTRKKFSFRDIEKRARLNKSLDVAMLEWLHNGFNLSSKVDEIVIATDRTQGERETKISRGQLATIHVKDSNKYPSRETC